MVRYDRFTGTRSCSLRSKGRHTLYQPGAIGFRVGRRDTLDAIYRIDDGVVVRCQDRYPALRAGLLEARELMSGIQLYDPSAHVRGIEGRNALPWDGLIAALDKAGMPGTRQKALSQPAPGPAPAFLSATRRPLDGDVALIQRQGEPIERRTAAELAELWSGEIVLLATREGLATSVTRFDYSWFLPQIVRYRSLIGEVLLITLALNLLGLAAPLFFQNIVDKVLVHNTLSTLKVLAIGFIAVSVWETAFGWLRTRLYSETSQKIDVELGSRLFQHLLKLPLRYFEARRVGDTAARVRQLETIREFLTNASLSVLVDPVFTVVFLVAMGLYSRKLLLISLVAMVCYVVVASLMTKPLRAGVAEKFERGAVNNAFLVEAIGGIQTVKAAAVEPQWQGIWERQLAGYSQAGQRVINMGCAARSASSCRRTPLFSRTVREDIALYDPAAPMEQVFKASQLAGAHEFVVRMPQGYDTRIEERGINLSGGQRQRTAIARALMTRPRILIFDEATAALDAESEEIIQTNLRAIAKGRTVLIIAHRLSAIRRCDRIITIEKGRIVEMGSHDELIALDGRYADLHRRQMGVATGAIEPGDPIPGDAV